MAKKEKVWRVKPEYVGRVTIEQECNHVVLNGELAQDDLAELAENPTYAFFLEQITQPVTTNEG